MVPPAGAGYADAIGGPAWLHEDAGLVAVDKPSGLLSVPGRGDFAHDSVAQRVQARHPDAMVVHRLDMETSGLMLMARGRSMAGALGQLFEKRQVHKRYEAVVEGWVEPTHLRLDAPMRVDWPNRPRQVIDPVAGKPALTNGEVLERLAADDPRNSWGLAVSRVALWPCTGRSHQLRLHLAHAGHPVLGDSLYASPAARAASPRLLLHASRLALVHPATGEPLRLASPVPF